MVWARPLFTFLYSFPAQLGYEAARLFTVLISVLTAWQTWRVAKQFDFPRAELAIPFLFFQPSFFLLSHETMTEPLFGLLLITALSLHLKGKIKLAAFVASLMILVRPEGFFLGLLWGVWILFDERAGKTLVKRTSITILLATGSFLWVIASWLITGDALFIKHNWPGEWNATGGLHGTGTIFAYVVRLPEIVGLLFLPPFLFGLAKASKQKSLITITSSFFFLFILHTIFRMFGLFSSAGYPRYFVCVSPVIALLTLYGWNELASRLKIENKTLKIVFSTITFAVSIFLCFLYIDGAHWNRDAVAVREAYSHFEKDKYPVSHFHWSQAAMGILFDRDNSGQPYLTGNKEQNLEILRDAPKGTLVFWDAQTGPKTFDLKAEEIIALGYRKLYSQSYVLKGYLLPDWWTWYGAPKHQEMYLLYKE